MQILLQAYKAFRLHKDLFNLDRITNKNENILAGAAVLSVQPVTLGLVVCNSEFGSLKI